jgi:hypothetical protein
VSLVEQAVRKSRPTPWPEPARAAATVSHVDAALEADRPAESSGDW